MPHTLNVVLHLLPFLPLPGRLLLVLRFWVLQGNILDEAEHDREGFRAYILAFAGFSFLGVSAFAIVETSLKPGLTWAIYYLMLSFFAYMFSLNLVSYKDTRGADQIATAFAEIGTLTLFLALIATLIATNSGSTSTMAAVATIIWGADHTYRLTLDWKYQTKLLRLRNKAP